eukprot:3030115-Amphidinium_carterae.1
MFTGRGPGAEPNGVRLGSVALPRWRSMEVFREGLALMLFPLPLTCGIMRSITRRSLVSCCWTLPSASTLCPMKLLPELELKLASLLVLFSLFCLLFGVIAEFWP